MGRQSEESIKQCSRPCQLLRKMPNWSSKDQKGKVFAKVNKNQMVSWNQPVAQCRIYAILFPFSLFMKRLYSFFNVIAQAGNDHIRKLILPQVVQLDRVLDGSRGPAGMSGQSSGTAHSAQKLRTSMGQKPTFPAARQRIPTDAKEASAPFCCFAKFAPIQTRGYFD